MNCPGKPTTLVLSTERSDRARLTSRCDTCGRLVDVEAGELVAHEAAE